MHEGEGVEQKRGDKKILKRDDKLGQGVGTLRRGWGGDETPLQTVTNSKIGTSDRLGRPHYYI